MTKQQKINKLKERIEENSGVKLNDFPKSDFRKISELLEDNEEIEVWLLKGMGRYYVSGFLPDVEISFPIKRKLCILSTTP